MWAIIQCIHMQKNLCSISLFIFFIVNSPSILFSYLIQYSHCSTYLQYLPWVGKIMSTFTYSPYPPYFICYPLYWNYAKVKIQKIKYSKAELLNLRPKAHITRMGNDTCNHIKNLKIKQNFRRKRGGHTCQKIWDNNKGIHQNLLQPLNRSDKTLWYSTNLNMALINIQLLKPKLDMLICHMQLNNLDKCFITESWTQCGNEPECQYIKANLDTVGYTIIIHSRENRKEGGIAVMHKSHLHVKKLSFNEHISSESITINLNITTKSYLFLTICRAPYSAKQPVTMLTFLEEFPVHISSLFRSSRDVIILGDFNISWNKPKHPNTTSMQEILDMYDLHQHINIQTHKHGNTLDWLISNSPETIKDIMNKDLLSHHSIIEWKLQINQKVSEKIQTRRRDITNINEESFISDLKDNLDVDMEKTLWQKSQ